MPLTELSRSLTFALKAQVCTQGNEPFELHRRLANKTARDSGGEELM